MNAINWLIWAHCVRQFIADVLQRNPRISLAFFWAQKSRVNRSILVLAGVVLKVVFPGNEVQPEWFFYGWKYFEYKAEKYSKYSGVFNGSIRENHEKLFGLNRMLRHGSFDFFFIEIFWFFWINEVPDIPEIDDETCETSPKIQIEHIFWLWGLISFCNYLICNARKWMLLIAQKSKNKTADISLGSYAAHNIRFSRLSNHFLATSFSHPSPSF